MTAVANWGSGGAALIGLFLFSCSSSQAGGMAGAASTDGGKGDGSHGFRIGGTVTGLSGSGLLLSVNGVYGLAVENGRFTFPVPLPSQSTYAVTVESQPSGPIQTCTVDHGSGTLVADVTNVGVTCAKPGYTVGGTVQGLAVRSGGGTGVVLQAAGAADLTILLDGPFTFGALLDTGSAYAITVKSQPENQTCTVSHGSGTMGTENVTNVSVSCADTRSLSGYVSGLGPRSSVVLKNEGVDVLTITGGYSFTLPIGVQIGAPYDVTVGTQPSDPAQTCVVTGGTGTMGLTNVSDLYVTCTPAVYGVYVGTSGNSGPIHVYDNGVLTFVAPPSPLTITWSNLPLSLAAGSTYNFTVDYPSPGPGERWSLLPPMPSQSGTVSGNVDLVVNSNRTCQSILEDEPSSPSGMYALHASFDDALDAYCDMTFDGGGWVLVSSTNFGRGPGRCPGRETLPVTPGSCASVPGNVVTDLASLGSQVHIRSPGAPSGTPPSTYITSVPNTLPIQNLAGGNLLDLPGTLTNAQYESFWTVVGLSPTVLDLKCIGYLENNWPDVYETCQSYSFNLHDNDSSWGVDSSGSNANIPLEVYVR